MRQLLLFTFCCSLFAQLPQGVNWSSQVINKAPAYPWDQAQSIAVDSSGNAYVAGLTYSNGLTVTAGVVQAQFGGGLCLALPLPAAAIPCADIFLAKYDPSGNLLFMTYLGGNDLETITSLAADDTGVYLTGQTWSQNFPASSGPAPTSSSSSGFVTKLSPDGGKILYSTFMSGVVLVATSGSRFFTATRVPTGCSITSLDATTAAVSGNLIFARPCAALAAAPDGSVVIAGAADAGLPPTPGAWQTTFGGGTDAYVAKLSADLSGIVWTTYAGGSGDDAEQLRLAVNSNGEVFLGGVTRSLDFPVTPGAWLTTPSKPCGQNSMVCEYLVRLSSDGSRALYSTFVPGFPTSLAAEADGQVVVAIRASDDPFPILPGGEWPCVQTSSQNRIARLDASGNPIWQTWEGLVVPAAAIAVPSHDHLVATGNITRPAELSFLGGGTAIRGPFTNEYPSVSDFSTVASLPSLVGTCVQQTAFPFLPIAPKPFIDANAQQSPIVPGELISIYGAGIGPEQGIAVPPGSLAIPLALGGVQVLFDDTPAPLLYASDQQINAVVPFGLAGKSSTTIHVKTPTTDASLQAPVTNAAPEILMLANSDGSANSVDNPAHRGDNVTIYASGVGLMTPSVMDGVVPPSPVRKIVQPVSIDFLNPTTITVPAEITYMGEAPLQVSGIVQINFRIPNIDAPQRFTFTIAGVLILYSVYVQ